LTHLSNKAFAAGLQGIENAVVITHPRLADLVPKWNVILLTLNNTKDIFYQVLEHFVQTGAFSTVRSFTHPTAQIASSAFVDAAVWIGDDAVVGPGAVILSNTVLESGVRIKPNVVIGGDGFELTTIGGRLRLARHAGGVWVGTKVEVGSSTCIDKGLFGDFTFVGADTKIDNLAHVAHSARIAKDCPIAACAEISGSLTIEEGAWVGPNVAVNQFLTIGASADIGTGSVLTRSTPPYSLAFGSPAKVCSAVCACGTKPTFVEERATCSGCSRQFSCSSCGAVNPLSEGGE
jgi:UDP-3-O-[3-hydroxymyristoyl] glucosamine N-acyltransferase